MYDVVIVGASVSGCTAATIYGRAGLRVALLEKHRSLETPKKLCGHFLLGGSEGVLARLGAEEPLVAAGSGRGQLNLHGPAGPFLEPAGRVPPFISARRSLLDPTLRRIAAATPGVDLLLGHGVSDLVREGGRVVGVRAGGRTFHGRLVVGADGHRSKVAALAEVPETRSPNARGFLYGYYRNVIGASRDRATIWSIDGVWSVVAPTDDGLTHLVVMPPKDDLPADADELATYLERHIAALPSGPDVSEAQRVDKLVVSRDYPLIQRHPTPHPGLVLIGDAALTSDPTPATGCTWAAWSGAWLADTTADPLLRGRDLDPGLAAYRRAHRHVRREFWFISQDARTGRASPVQRLLWRAATRDSQVAWRVMLFGAQAAPVTSLLRPSVLTRAVACALKPVPGRRPEPNSVAA